MSVRDKSNPQHTVRSRASAAAAIMII